MNPETNRQHFPVSLPRKVTAGVNVPSDDLSESGHRQCQQALSPKEGVPPVSA